MNSDQDIPTAANRPQQAGAADRLGWQKGEVGGIRRECGKNAVRFPVKKLGRRGSAALPRSRQRMRRLRLRNSAFFLSDAA